MRMVLIEIKGLGPTFLAERDPDEAGSSSGVVGRLARMREALIDRLEKPGTILGATLGRVWLRLQRLVAPDEHLLRRLRRAESLAIDHPARSSSEHVKALWGDLLTRRRRKHRFWLVVDSLLAAPAAFLALLPGPNLIGYWLFYRAIVHLLALLGVRAGGTVDTILVPHTELDEIVDPADADRVARLSAHLMIPEFAALMAAYAPTTRPNETTRP